MPGAVRHDPSVGRAAALHRLMAAVREEAGEDVFVLACGAPLGPCIGHVDALRVSADAATHWLPTGIDLPGTRWFFASDRTNLPAARNMVRNVAVRMPMSGRLWRNDPDCLILREAGADFTLAQAQALATVAALSAGAMIFSDPPTALPPPRLAVLQRVLPPLPRAAVALDLLKHEIPAQLVVPLSAADREGGSGGSGSGSSGGGGGGGSSGAGGAASGAADLLDSWWLVGLFNWSSVAAHAGGDGEGGVPVRSLLAASDVAAHGRTVADPSVGRSHYAAPQTPGRRSLADKVLDPVIKRAGAAIDAAAPAAAALASALSPKKPEGGAPAAAAAAVPEEAWHAFDVWGGTYQRLHGEWPMLAPPVVPPRCGVLVALRRVRTDGAAQLVGTDVHVSAGLEVHTLHEVEPFGHGVVELKLHAGRAVAAPRVWLYLPATHERKPPRLETLEVFTSLVEALEAPGDPPLPAPVWVSDCVWMLTLGSIGRDGVSCGYRITFA